MTRTQNLENEKTTVWRTASVPKAKNCPNAQQAGKKETGALKAPQQAVMELFDKDYLDFFPAMLEICAMMLDH